MDAEKPKIIKLLKLYALQQRFDNKISDGFICKGIWETRSVAYDEQGHRWFELVCVMPFSDHLSIGDKRKMYEDVIIEICEQIEIVRKPIINQTNK